MPASCARNRLNVLRVLRGVSGTFYEGYCHLLSTHTAFCRRSWWSGGVLLVPTSARGVLLQASVSLQKHTKLKNSVWRPLYEKNRSCERFVAQKHFSTMLNCCWRHTGRLDALVLPLSQADVLSSCLWNLWVRRGSVFLQQHLLCGTISFFCTRASFGPISTSGCSIFLKCEPAAGGGTLLSLRATSVCRLVGTRRWPTVRRDTVAVAAARAMGSLRCWVKGQRASHIYTMSLRVVCLFMYM